MASASRPQRGGDAGSIPAASTDEKLRALTPDSPDVLIEEAANIKRNTATIRRSADRIDDSYQRLREEALTLLDQIKHKIGYATGAAAGLRWA
jgi:hypothetical protein